MHPSNCRTLTYVMPVLFTFNLQTKFEVSSFIRSKDMAWVKKRRNGSHGSGHAYLGIVSYHKANTSHGQLVGSIKESIWLTFAQTVTF